MEDKDKFIDKLLDTALARHPSAEPRPGLEARILERVRAAGSEQVQRHRLWIYVAAATAAALVIVAAALLLGRQHGPAVQSPRASRTVSVQPQRKELAINPKPNLRQNEAAPVLKAKLATRKGKRRPFQVEVHHWPLQFPSPAPLTPEEKALIRYVQETPPQVLAKPQFTQQARLQPIEIKPLGVPPLEIKPLGSRPTREEIE